MTKSADDLRQFMELAPHVGNSPNVQRSAAQASALEHPDDRRLATLYFSAAYFSTPQSIEIDALRYAIDIVAPRGPTRDWLLSAWLSAAGALINAPGHTAQFLKPTTEAVASRIRRQWMRSMWSLFTEQLDNIVQLGERSWRLENVVTSKDALDLVTDDALEEVGAVYADPPYTVDHYSRFYHVYETLYRYDFPKSVGSGRYRDDRFFTPFSHVRGVEEAFRKLTSTLADREKPLVLSYPAKGVLFQAGLDLRSLLSASYRHVRVIEIQTKHSTLGGSSGANSKKAVENVYVCKS
ncbi:MAG TPA: DNA adenine methylase [Solirubrobacterales bacterium]|nr:DNA adenine methylase [Solirubrobacterales bacterium]